MTSKHKSFFRCFKFESFIVVFNGKRIYRVYMRLRDRDGQNLIDSKHSAYAHMYIAYTFVYPSSGMLKEKGLKTLDGRARSAGVSRNWSVLYVSYLEVTIVEGVYKLYVVYRRQRSERFSGRVGGTGGRGTTVATRRKLLLLPPVYPYDSAANQRIRSSGSRRLSACPPEAEAIRFRRFHNSGARGVSQRNA